MATKSDFIVRSGITVNTNATVGGNLILSNTSAVLANGVAGSSGQVLTSNGSAVYWTTAAAGVDTAAQYTWSNTQTFTNTITFNSTIVGTVNNSLYLNGNSASDLNTYANDKAANAYSNAIAYSGNAALAYSNAVAYVDGKAYVNSSQLSLNLASYQTTAGLSSNVATLTANNSNYLGGTAAANFVQNTDSRTLSGNLVFTGTNINVSSNATFSGSFVNATAYNTGTTGTGTGGLVANVTTLFIGNNTINSSLTSTESRIGGTLIANSTGPYGKTEASLSVNNAAYLGGTIASSYQLNSTLSANVATLTANNTSFVGSVSAANVVSNSQLQSNLSNYAVLAGATFTGAVNVSNNVIVTGNLTVTGSTLYANVTNLDVKDLNITVAKGVATAAGADGAGLTVDTANIGWYYNYASNTWQSNVGITPSANNLSLGSASNLWNITANQIAGTLTTTSQPNITANNSTNLGGVAAASYVQNTDSRTLSGNLIFSGANVTYNGALRINAGAAVLDSTGSQGTVGQVLASNGTSNVYWTSTVLTANNSTNLGGTAAATYVQNTDSRTLSGNLAFSGAWHNVSSNAVFSGTYVNATAYNTGTTGTGTGGLVANVTTLFIGNNTINSSLTSTESRIGGVLIANSTGPYGKTEASLSVNNSSNLGGTAAANFVQNTDSRTLSGNLVFSGANVTYSGALRINAGATVLDSTGSQGTVGQVLASNGTGNVYWTTVITSIPATYVQNTDSRTLSGNLVFTGQYHNVSSNAVFSGTYVNATAYNTGTTGTGTGGLVANVTTLFIGNNTINSSLTSTESRIGGVLIANSTGPYGKTEINLNVNSAAYLGTVAAASYVQNTDSRTLSGNLVFSAANNTLTGTLRINSGGVVIDSTGSQGAIGQVLASNGTGNVYWTSTALSANNSTNLGGVAAANYVQNTDSRTLSGNLIFSGANVTHTGALRFNSGATILDSTGSQGTNGQVLASNGTGNVYWTTPAAAATVNKVYQSYTASDGQTIFAVTGGYTNNYIEVFYNGVHLSNTEYTQDGSNVTLASAANGGALVEVSGYTLSGAGLSNYVQYTDSRTLTGNLVFTGTNMNVSSIITFSGNLSSNTTGVQILGPTIETNSTPFYTWSGDNTTGILNPASGTIALSSAGTPVLTVNSTQLTISGTSVSTNGSVGTSGYVMTSNGSTGSPYWKQDQTTVLFIIDGGGSTITTGQKGHLEIPFNCTINAWTLIADQSGSVVVDIWRTTYSGAPPTVSNTITGSSLPTLSSVQKNQSSTLTGWTTTLAAGDILAFNVNSATTVQRVSLNLRVTKT